ncbi:ABC transporter permease [Glycomyces sp. A-F 0318]|uniref:ABC transporter permease n=1 Tax=Glycomyces amatae TaxID=2881355 RepID=UPI001E3E0E34|nr:ABC transporter permease [Glycomyces amatae]MCD0445723.1 ABC transporter permease [Glycomyces amatae]
MTPEPSRLRGADLAGLAAAGMRARPLRAVLSALGIAVGIAAMVVVVGISASSRAEVEAQLERLGTNLLTVSPGRSITGEEASLPPESVEMVGRIGPVTSVGAIGEVDANVYRNEAIDPNRSNGIAVYAATVDLLGTVGGEVAAGRFLDEALAAYPTTVLGATTAERLGISVADGSVAVWIGDARFTVVGVLEPVPLAPELDASALVGWPAAEAELGFDGAPTTIFERSPDETVAAVREVLAATANPEAPQETVVSRPSDALAAKAATDRTLTTLLLSLGGVALLVGGIGVANTMVIAVLERRSEIGLRRSLGATRAHIRLQFLAESMLLAGAGGIGGAVLGGAVTAGFALWQGWPVAIPLWALALAAAATVAVGAVAGVYPAAKAARYSPTIALSSY